MKAFRFSLRTGVAIFVAASVLLGAGMYYRSYYRAKDHISHWVFKPDYKEYEYEAEFFLPLGSGGIEALRETLHNKNGWFSEKACNVIRCMGSKASAVIPDLISLLDDKNNDLVIFAITALEAMGSVARDAIPKLKNLAANAPYISLDIVSDMAPPLEGELPDQEYQEYLIYRWHPREPMIRRYAQAAIEKIESNTENPAQ